MSLICASCLKAIVVSDHPDHYGICAKCGNEKPREELEKALKEAKN